ncbi:MAG: hypothetical protein KF916_04515 [Microbacteriaceae bacterium]|nr:hypothetical protein [Microbacteriaceae bacterium]
MAEEARLNMPNDGGTDSAAVLYIHAGIAASDVICLQKLGSYSISSDHNQAVTLLSSIDGVAAKHLRTLLSFKNRASYGYDPISVTEILKISRAASSLVSVAKITSSKTS